MTKLGYCRNFRAQDLEAALGVAATLLPAYESMLRVPYPLTKLDLVAIPDFAAGASSTSEGGYGIPPSKDEHGSMRYLLSTMIHPIQENMLFLRTVNPVWTIENKFPGHGGAVAKGSGVGGGLLTLIDEKSRNVPRRLLF